MYKTTKPASLPQFLHRNSTYVDYDTVSNNSIGQPICKLLNGLSEATKTDGWRLDKDDNDNDRTGTLHV